MHISGGWGGVRAWGRGRGRSSQSGTFCISVRSCLSVMFRMPGKAQPCKQAFLGKGRLRPAVATFFYTWALCSHHSSLSCSHQRNPVPCLSVTFPQWPLPACSSPSDHSLPVSLLSSHYESWTQLPAGCLVLLQPCLPQAWKCPSHLLVPAWLLFTFHSPGPLRLVSKAFSDAPFLSPDSQTRIAFLWSEPFILLLWWISSTYLVF